MAWGAGVGAGRLCDSVRAGPPPRLAPEMPLVVVISQFNGFPRTVVKTCPLDLPSARRLETIGSNFGPCGLCQHV